MTWEIETEENVLISESPFQKGQKGVRRVEWFWEDNWLHTRCWCDRKYTRCNCSPDNIRVSSEGYCRYASLKHTEPEAAPTIQSSTIELR